MTDIMKRDINAQPCTLRSTGSILNRKRHKDELQRMTEQNQRIMKTLQNIKPTMSCEKWEQDAKKNIKLMAKMYVAVQCAVELKWFNELN